MPADDIREAARTYAAAESAAICYAMGITQHTTGTDNVVTLANLAMLTGNIGRPGTGVNPLRGQNNVQGACDVGALPNVYTGYQAVADPELRKKFAEAWGVALPAEPGLTATEMMDAAAGGEVRAMYIIGENPMLSDPNLRHAGEALEKLDFLVVQDIFLTETALLADVVLPSASFAEKEGTFTNTDRRVQRVRTAVSPPGEAKPDSEIVAEISRRMGYEIGERGARRGHGRDSRAHTAVRRHKLRPAGRRREPPLAVHRAGAPRHPDPSYEVLHQGQGMVLPRAVRRAGGGA